VSCERVFDYRLRDRPVAVLETTLWGQEALHGQLCALGGGETPRGLH